MLNLRLMLILIVKLMLVPMLELMLMLMLAWAWSLCLKVKANPLAFGVQIGIPKWSCPSQVGHVFWLELVSVFEAYP